MMLQSYTIKTNQAFIKNFNGQACSREIEQFTLGASKETKLYNLTVGGGLYLRDDEVVAQASK